MKVKLPLILSAMFAALAVPSLAADAAPEAAPAADAAAPAADAAAAPAADATKAEHKGKKHKHSGKHRKGHKHHRGHHGAAHTGNPYDLAYDDPNFPRGSGDTSGCSAEAPTTGGKVLPPEVPGQPGPHVPAGQ